MGIGDFVKGVVGDVLDDLLKKASGPTKRARRRKRATTTTATMRELEALLKPAKRQTSRRKTVRSRSKARRRSA